MIAGPLSLRAVLALSLFATSALTKPQTHDSVTTAAQSSLEQSDASLFERCKLLCVHPSRRARVLNCCPARSADVASHLRHHSQAADVTSSPHTSHLSTLLHNAHEFVVSGRSAPKERSAKMVLRANALASKTPAKARAAPSPGTASERRLGKASSAHGSRTVWHVVKRSFNENTDEDDVTADEESWTWMEGADEESEDNSGIGEEAQTYAIQQETAARTRMVVRTKRPAAEPLAVI